jgi:hypothetical protein
MIDLGTQRVCLTRIDDLEIAKGIFIINIQLLVPWLKP